LYLAFAKKNGLLGKLIDWFSGRGGYCHCAVVFGDGMLTESQAPKGVRFRDRLPTSGYVFYKIDVPEHLENKARILAELTAGAEYDYGAIGQQLTPLALLRHDDDKWICSEYAVALLHAMHLAGDLVAAETSPNELESWCRSNGFERTETLPSLP
jgi:O-methyltransferase involved in polyketide biosynthesis